MSPEFARQPTLKRGEAERAMFVQRTQLCTRSFSRLLFQRDIRIASRRVDETGVIRPVGVGWQKPTAVGRDNLEAGEAVERALEDQVRQRDRRLGWQANRVREPAIAFETLGQFRNRLRVDEEHRAELFGLGPDGMEFRVRKVFTGDAAANSHSAQPLLFHRVLELLYRQVRKLQGNRSKGGEAVRLRRAKLGKFLIVYPDDLGREIALL